MNKPLSEHIDPRIGKLQNTLDAGEIIRYHAVPSVRQQTNGQHCWNMIALALFISHGDLSAEFFVELSMHDTGEFVTGDTPFTLKRDHPVLAHELRLLEAVGRGMQTICEPIGLCAREQAILKVCDVLEGYLWCAKYEHGPVFDRWESAYASCRSRFHNDLRAGEWERADSVFAFYKEWRDSR